MLQASRNSALRSWISLNRRTFSIAITAWSAKVLSSETCLSVNGRTSVRRISIAPRETPFTEQRRCEDGPNTVTSSKPRAQSRLQSRSPDHEYE